MTSLPTLLIHPDAHLGEYVRVTPERAGWELLHFAADALTIGRCAVDFYCNDIGVPLKHARWFNMYLGGCSANAAVGARRPGLMRRPFLLKSLTSWAPGERR